MLLNDLKDVLVSSTYIRIYSLRGKMLYEGYLKFTHNKNDIYNYSINTMFFNDKCELIITLNK